MFDFFEKLVPDNAFGLYVTDKYIQALQLKKVEKKGQVAAIGQRNIPSGTVKNGEILEERTLAKEIQILLSTTKPSPIKSKKCIVAIPENQSFEHIFYLPASLKGDEFKEQLDKLVEGTIPLPFYEAKYDYSVSLHDKIQVVFVVAARRLIIAQYYEVLKKFCGLEPAIFEPESLSLLRNIPIKLGADNGTILIDIKGDKINWFSLWGTDIFDSCSVAKQEYENEPGTLIKSLQKAVDSFKKMTARNIVNIVISGSRKDAKTLSESIKKVLNLPINVIDKCIVAPKLNEDADPDQFKIVSGLALKGMGIGVQIQINLLKK